jgi:hypothetical protein
MLLSLAITSFLVIYILSPKLRVAMFSWNSFTFKRVITALFDVCLTALWIAQAYQGVMWYRSCMMFGTSVNLTQQQGFVVTENGVKVVATTTSTSSGETSSSGTTGVWDENNKEMCKNIFLGMVFCKYIIYYYH